MGRPEREQRKQQREWHDREYQEQMSGRSVGPWAGLPRSRVGSLMAWAPVNLALRQPGLWRGTVLVACAGMGTETELLRHSGAEQVVAVDISLQGLLGQRRQGGTCLLVVGDACRLPFRDRAFDAALVRQGLHHLPDPIQGIRELSRVSRRGFAFCEAQDSVVTRLAIALGITTRTEEGPSNVIYRFGRGEIRRLFSQLPIRHYRICTFFASLNPLLARHVYPMLDRFPGFTVFRIMLGALNATFGRWGNALVAWAAKREDSR